MTPEPNTVVLLGVEVPDVLEWLLLLLSEALYKEKYKDTQFFF